MRAERMTVRERLLAAISGKPVDRIPCSPFLAYYFESLPAEIQAKGQFEYLKAMGADPLLRGSATLTSCVTPHCSIEAKNEGKKHYGRLITPAGSLDYAYTYSAEANSMFLTEHHVKTVEDCKILTAYFEDMIIDAAPRQYEELRKETGENALIIPNFNSFAAKSAFQHLIEHWIGIENLVYLLADDENAVTELWEAFKRCSRKSVELTVSCCDAPYFFAWEDSSTLLTSPSLYEKYIHSELEDWCAVLKKAGRGLIHHACGHLKGLTPVLARSSIAAIESFPTAPTGDIELEAFRKAMPPGIALIGGIEPVNFLNYDLVKLEKYIYEILEIMRGSRFVLANSDSCPPGVKYESFLTAVNAVRK